MKKRKTLEVDKWSKITNFPTKENVWGLNTWKGAKEKPWYSLLIFFLEVVDNFSNHLWENAVLKIISFKGTFATQ
jgi:hypothetical protein